MVMVECKKILSLPDLRCYSLSDFASYAELIRNRAFQGSTDNPSTVYPWTAVGSAALALDSSNSLSTALPTSLAVTASADGTVGVRNPGWWGSKSSLRSLIFFFFFLSFAFLSDHGFGARSRGKKMVTNMSISVC